MQAYCVKTEEETMRKWEKAEETETNKHRDRDMHKESHETTDHINASVLTVMDFVVANNWITACPDLNASKSVSINVVELDKSASFTKDVDSTLVAIEDLVFPTINSFQELWTSSSARPNCYCSLESQNQNRYSKKTQSLSQDKTIKDMIPYIKLLPS